MLAFHCSSRGRALFAGNGRNGKSQRLLQQDQIPEAILPFLGLLGGRLGQGASGITTIAGPALHAGLDSNNAALDSSPVPLCDDLLHGLSLGIFALVVELDGLDACLGGNVGETGKDAVAAGNERLDGEVGRSSKNEEFRLVWVLPLGKLSGGGSDAVQLARITTSELDAHDVGMLRELHNDVRGQVHAVDGTREVVDDDRDRGGIGHGVEELNDGLHGRGEEGCVVRRGQDQCVVSACLPSFTAVLDRLTGALAAAANDDGHVREAGIVEGFPGGCCNQLPLGVGEVDGLTIGALGSKASDACFGQSYGMASNGSSINVLCSLLEEAHCGDVDTRHKRPLDVERCVHVAAAVGAAQGGMGVQGHQVVCEKRRAIGTERWYPVEAGSVAT